MLNTAAVAVITVIAIVAAIAVAAAVAAVHAVRCKKNRCVWSDILGRVADCIQIAQCMAAWTAPVAARLTVGTEVASAAGIAVVIVASVVGVAVVIVTSAVGVAVVIVASAVGQITVPPLCPVVSWVVRLTSASAVWAAHIDRTAVKAAAASAGQGVYIVGNLIVSCEDRSCVVVHQAIRRDKSGLVW